MWMMIAPDRRLRLVRRVGLGGADNYLDYLEVVHVFIRTKNSGCKAVHQAGKTPQRNHSSAGLHDAKLIRSMSATEARASVQRFFVRLQSMVEV